MAALARQPQTISAPPISAGGSGCRSSETCDSCCTRAPQARREIGALLKEEGLNRPTSYPNIPPTKPSPRPPGLGSVLEGNIRVLERRRALEAAKASFEERLAAAITRFTGSMRFVYLHLAVFGAWIVANLGVIAGMPQFDPSFVILAMTASVEAIFLSTFVLISQNRMAASADKRAELDLQISLLAEHEVTKLVAMVCAIADRLGLETEVDQELAELKQDVAPEVVLDEIEERTPNS